MDLLRRDLAALVAFPTVSNRPVTELAAFVAERLQRMGFAVDLDASAGSAGKVNLVARIGPKGTDGLVVSGHMDVVPTEGQPWTTDPFEVTEREGRLYGRGTADMKGFLAAVLCGLERIPAKTYERELVLVFTHDEEVGCLGSAALAAELRGRGESLPSACWIGEPTGFQVQRMHPGHVALAVDLVGKAAHSSRPELGVNAIRDASRVITAIAALAEQIAQERRSDLPGVERPWVPINVATIRGGSAINVVPDRCRVEVGYRPLPGMDPMEVLHRIEALVAGLPLEGRAEVSLQRITPSLCTRADTAMVETLRPFAMHSDLGASTFATDGGNLATVGCEPLVFGPGSIAVAHQADEYVPAEDLVRAVEVVEKVVRTRCTGGPIGRLALGGGRP